MICQRSSSPATSRQVPLWGAATSSRRARRVACPATLDDPELQELVKQLELMTPPPPSNRDKLARAIQMIDDVNAQDPTTMPVNGREVPYRLAYAQWVSEWVVKLYPAASDELLILARGRNIESWKLATIKRDDYAPNTPGLRQWEFDRKQWLATRLADVVQEAGYPEASVQLIKDVMMGKNIPDPRDIRKYDLVGALGMINYKLLEASIMLQALADADALVFLEKNFADMFNRLPAEEVLATLKRECSRMSQRAMVVAMKQEWSPVQQRMLMKALPVPFKYADYLMTAEGMAAASTHPGDWRYKDFDYE